LSSFLFFVSNVVTFGTYLHIICQNPFAFVSAIVMLEIVVYQLDISISRLPIISSQCHHPDRNKSTIATMTNTIYLITGASRGIGRGLAEIFLARPNTIVIAAVRDPAGASS
jgi:hypothetical protein